MFILHYFTGFQPATELNEQWTATSYDTSSYVTHCNRGPLQQPLPTR